jgi:hypothetical protein
MDLYRNAKLRHRRARPARTGYCKYRPRLRARDLALLDKSQGGRWRDANGRPIRHVFLS